MFRGLLGIPAVGEALRNVMSFGRRPVEPGTLQGLTRAQTGNIDWTFDNQATLPATQFVLRTSLGPFLRFSTIDNGTIYFGPADNPYSIGGAGGKLAFGFVSGPDQFNLTVSRIELSTSIVANGQLGVGYCFKQDQYTETIDLRLLRDAAGTLAQRNGTNAQTFRLYETFTDSSNGAWLSLQATGTRYEIGGKANGTGNVRPVMVQHGTVTVANLPSASTAGAGARMVVSDASSPTFGSTVTGGSSTVIPVFSDGTTWKVG